MLGRHSPLELHTNLLGTGCLSTVVDSSCVVVFLAPVSQLVLSVTEQAPPFPAPMISLPL